MGEFVNKVLVVAFHFPPMTHSSGVQRTLKFVRYLRDAGWEAIVLSADPRAYVSVGDKQMADIPAGMLVERAFALDTARHLSIAGRFPGFLANPDRWASWLPFAVAAGRRLIRKHRPAAIFSTYPIATAHLIAASLARRSGLPWVADFRDSMFDAEYPADQALRAIHQRVEGLVVHASNRVVFTTPSTRDMYISRYPELPASHWEVIPNGYDEADFSGMGLPDQASRAGAGRRRVLLHSGVLYPVERDPLPFFRALRTLVAQGHIDPDNLVVRLRGTAHDHHYAPVIRGLGLADLVELAKPLPYLQALKEMTEADALLLFQAAGCNHQVPAKLYEYLRAQRPIITLTDASGDTAAVLREAGADNILPLDDEQALVRELPALLARLDRGMLNLAPMARVTRYSRARGAADLARILDAVTRSNDRPVS